MSTYRCSGWQIETPWAVPPERENFLLQPATGDAELEIDTYDYATHSTDKVLRQSARNRAPKGVQLQETSCGQFAGVSYEYVDSEGLYQREWFLGLAELVLFVTYTSSPLNAERDRAIVDQMLSTLRDARP